MTQQEMQLLVPQKLKEIEKEYGIRVLYAVESGSRAWGTNSRNSDFDIRFLYIRPQEEYLRLVPHRDVLEFEITDGWDMCGWDLAKTLRLLNTANSQIYEWFASPVVYLDYGFSQRFRPLLDAYFVTRTAVYHYLHQARMKMERLQKSEQAKVKHYLYSLQYLAAARWILLHEKSVDLGFRGLMPMLPEDIRQEAEALLQHKITQPQQPLIPHIPHLDAWLWQEYEQILRQVKQFGPLQDQPWELLDRFFREELHRL